jgi:hypothetical protein
MRTDAGLTLALGETALAAGVDGALINVADIALYGGGEGNAGTASAEDTVANNGDYYDFNIIGLPTAGDSARVVIPYTDPLPAGAVYRKYDSDTGWQDFVEDSKNSVASAPGLPGECPLPGDASFVAGLAAGYYCVQLTIEDGGPNDMDGSANHVIKDPGQISYIPAVINDPQPIDVEPIDTQPDQPQQEQPQQDQPQQEQPQQGKATTSTSMLNLNGGGALSLAWLWMLLSFYGIRIAVGANGIRESTNRHLPMAPTGFAMTTPCVMERNHPVSPPIRPPQRGVSHP